MTRNSRGRQPPVPRSANPLREGRRRLERSHLMDRHHDEGSMYPSSESTGGVLNNNAVMRGIAAGLAALALIAGGCGRTTEPPPPGRQPYANLGLRQNIPGFLQGTVMERVEVSNTGQMAVTSFGLAVNLRYPGDT